MKKTNSMLRLLPFCYRMLPLTGNRLATHGSMFINHLYTGKRFVTGVTDFVEIGFIEKVTTIFEAKKTIL